MTDKETKNLEIQRLEKLNDIHKEEKAMKEHSSGTFGIDILQLEELMGNYKERGVFFKDLENIKELGGPFGILEKLKTDSKNGIKSTDYREHDFGSNKLFIEPVPPFCSYVCEALEDLMVRILIVAAVVQIVLGATLSEDPTKDWIDGLSIIIAVLLVTLIGSITNYQKETKFHELNTIQNEGTTYKVIRDGKPYDLKNDEILVGDLVNIQVGDILPSDMILVEGNAIEIDESSLTGESDNVKKEPYDKCVKIAESANNNQNVKVPSPLMLSGTHCVEGTGLAVVLAVGDNSQKGIIKRTVDNAQENNQTPLEEKLNDIAENIGWFGMAAGGITLVALAIRFGISFYKNTKEYQKEASKKDLITSILLNYPEKGNNNAIFNTANNIITNPKSEISKNVLNIIMLCVSIIVVAIPEGLPLAVTLSLAFSVKKLMDKQNLVRKMHACETMGGANYICTDKTGTLTKNQMNVYKLLTGKSELIFKETVDNENVGVLDKEKNNEIKNIEKKIREDYNNYFSNGKYWEQLKIAIALNVDGQIEQFDNPDQNGDTETCETKNKTDKAFIDFLYRLKVKISNERISYIADRRYYKQIPFDSKRKRMTTLVKHDVFPTGYRLYTKGGAEKALLICKKFLNPETGEENEIREEENKFISENIKNFNKQKLRSLYVCYKDITEEEYENYETFKNPEGLSLDEFDCIFIGCVGIRDSLRNGVKEAVEKCRKARVNVIMVTGDNIITATAIAKDCNILGNDVDLDNLGPNDIETNSERVQDLMKKETYLNTILNNKPKAITGNTFFEIIGGLVCSTCGSESSLCKCPKTQAEAEEKAKLSGKKEEKIKKDTIRSMKKFEEITKNLKVMARSQPIHKYALVLGLRELGKIVAVTGDGTNDAPALSKSNVGFAMFDGTDIAKEASDIVIMDNNFSSIVVAIIYGRNIYDNIRKFLQFQLTVNFCACLLVFICACIGNETPLTTIQMLWINLIMDSLGSLALATEPPYEELLDREPTKKNESIINGKMWKHIIFQSLIQLGLLLFLYLYAPNFIKEDDLVRRTENYLIKFCYGDLPGGTNPDNIIFGTSTKWVSDKKLVEGVSENECGSYGSKQDLSVGYSEYIHSVANSSHMTIIFNVFVIYTLFNQINCRVINDSLNIFQRITNTIIFPIITICELILQVILTEFGKDAFKCTDRGLTGYQWLMCIAFSFVTFILSIIIKFIPIDKCIQNILDNLSKGNKVGNLDDLIADDRKETTDNITTASKDKTGLIKKEEDEKVNDNLLNDRKEDSKIQRESSFKRIMKKSSTLHIGHTLRQQKPMVHISNN